jgi:4-amino-4-deoxy-L-arabinose transferase-like glycosyltransferase
MTSIQVHPQEQGYWISRAAILVLAIAAVKLALQWYASHRYGYFVDELYYIACGDHLAWGYVDQPPLIALVVRLERVLLGDSLSALRFVPVLCGAAKVVLTAIVARELGGKLFAQGLTALILLIAPAFLAADSLATMNSFEPLIWTACAYVVIRMINTGNARLWLWFGVLAGIGLLNKHSMLIFGFAVIAGLILTRERRLLASRWLLAGGAIAAVIFLPNLLWNIQHHFPFLEIQENIRRSGRDVPLSPVAFFGQEFLLMLPLAAPVWIAGLWFYFLSDRGKPYRVLGWAWMISALLIVTLSPRVYYLFPAFPVLFAAGSVQCERWLDRPWGRWVKLIYVPLMVAVAAILAPLAFPILPVDTYIRYTRAIHMAPPAIETARLGPLPQLYADQFGWDEMAAATARVYNSLPADVRSRTAIFGQNYGQAGAIDFFGPRYGLPKAISGHQNYFLWGPREYTGESMIVLGDRKERLEEVFQSVEKVGHVAHPYSMPYEHIDIFYCRGLKIPMQQLWPRIKRWG